MTDPYHPIDEAAARRKKLIARIAWSVRGAAFIFLLAVLAGFTGWLTAPGVDWILQQLGATSAPGSAGVSGDPRPSVPVAEPGPLTVDYAGLRLKIPRGHFEHVPGTITSDGTTVIGPNAVRVAPVYALFLWGQWPDVRPMAQAEAMRGAPRSYESGVYFTVQPMRSDMPSVDAQEEIARDVLATTLAPVIARELVPGVVAIERMGERDFFARYTRPDGSDWIASCFGGTCKVDQVAWRDGLSFSFTIGQDQARSLADAEAKVRARLDSFVISE